MSGGVHSPENGWITSGLIVDLAFAEVVAGDEERCLDVVGFKDDHQKSMPRFLEFCKW